MKNHKQTHANTFEPLHLVKYTAARKSTWVSIWINLVLTILQLLGGFFAHSQALMADALHSLSDLLSDVLVLFANRHSNRVADARHPYGHARLETAATLVLGVFLAGLGVALLLAAASKIQHPEAIQAVNPIALAVAIVALLAKEGMFRYMLAVAKKVRSQMLVANAWHARSDAASSLVVAAGIVGNLLGYTFLDLLAAAIVGVMITHMGGKLAFEAMEELIDTSLEPAEVLAIEQTIRGIAGVQSVHELRTRKMADHPLVEAHIVVNPKISVSEGHYIAEAARHAVLQQHQALDAQIHIDPLDDKQDSRNLALPARDVLLTELQSYLPFVALSQANVLFHYLNGKVDVELRYDAAVLSEKQAQRVLQQVQQLIPHAYFNKISICCCYAL